MPEKEKRRKEWKESMKSPMKFRLSRKPCNYSTECGPVRRFFHRFITRASRTEEPLKGNYSSNDKNDFINRKRKILHCHMFIILIKKNFTHKKQAIFEYEEAVELLTK